VSVSEEFFTDQEWKKLIPVLGMKASTGIRTRSEAQRLKACTFQRNDFVEVFFNNKAGIPGEYWEGLITGRCDDWKPENPAYWIIYTKMQFNRAGNPMATQPERFLPLTSDNLWCLPGQKRTI
jgi:hypothetical protein